MSELQTLDEFSVSEWGFLPRTTLDSLPASWNIFQPVLDFIQAHQESISGNKYRELIHNTPLREDLINQIPTLSNQEVIYLYTFFSMVCQKYIWCCGPEKSVDTLPKQIGLPYYLLSKRLGLKPTLSYATLVLWNVRKKNPEKPYTIDNITLAINIAPKQFYESLEGFCAVHAAIEAKGGEMIQSMMTIRESILTDEKDKIKLSLKKISQYLKELRSILSEMYHYCDQEAFWGFRIYIGGTQDKNYFPEGLKIEGVEETFSLRGGSGTQSPLLQALDRFFHVEHNPEARSYFDEMKSYMYPPHAKFLDFLESKPHIREYVKESHDEELAHAYDKAVMEFVNYRKVHFKLVHDYIFWNIKKDEDSKEQREPEKKNIFGHKGTGGTDPHVFLLDVIDRTLNARVNVKSENAKSKDSPNESTSTSDQEVNFEAIENVRHRQISQENSNQVSEIPHHVGRNRKETFSQSLLRRIKENQLLSIFLLSLFNFALLILLKAYICS